VNIILHFTEASFEAIYINISNSNLLNAHSKLITQSILTCHVTHASWIENPYKINLFECITHTCSNTIYIYFISVLIYHSQHDIGLQHDFPNGSKFQHEIWKHLSDYATGWCKIDSDIPGLCPSCLANSQFGILSSCCLFKLFSCEQIRIPQFLLIHDTVTYVSLAGSLAQCQWYKIRLLTWFFHSSKIRS
jgi:hypothetical protein